jgi:hypothetical protein
MVKSRYQFKERKSAHSRIMVGVARFFAEKELAMYKMQTKWAFEQATALIAYLNILVEKGTFAYGIEGNTFVVRVEGKRNKVITVRVHGDGTISIDDIFPRHKRNRNMPAYMFVLYLLDLKLLRVTVPKRIRENRDAFNVFVADQLSVTLPSVGRSVREIFEKKQRRQTRKPTRTG